MTPLNGPIRRFLPDLPCGCIGSSANNLNVIVMHDGSRICRLHKRRFLLTYKEITY